MIKENIIVIYHGNCPDGFGGAYAAWKKFSHRAAYIPARDRSNPEVEVGGKIIYVIDHSYPKESLLEIERKAKKLVVLDHHISERDTVRSVREHVFDLKHSGCAIAWKYFHPGKPLPKLLKYVEKIDLGEYGNKSAQAAGVLLESKGLDFKKWDALVKAFENPKTSKLMMERGQDILAYEKMLIGYMIRSARLCKFSGHKMYALQIPKLPINFRSKIALALIDRGVPAAILWRSGDDGFTNVSLRSSPTVDVSRIAQKYGGGGHKQSAGFMLPADRPLPWKIIA